MSKTPVRKLNARQSAFVREYLVDLNATQAAIRAGYSENTAAAQASRLLRNVNVKSAIAKAKRERANKVEITAERVLKEAARLALYDVRKLYRDDGSLVPITELDDDIAAAIVGIDVTVAGNELATETTHRYRLADKNNALERLFKHLGLYELDNSQKSDPLTTLLHAISTRSNSAFTPQAQQQQHEEGSALVPKEDAPHD